MKKKKLRKTKIRIHSDINSLQHIKGSLNPDDNAARCTISQT